MREKAMRGKEEWSMQTQLVKKKKNLIEELLHLFLKMFVVL